MPYSHTLRGHTHRFADLRELMARANEEKSGDQLAGVAAESAQERVAAKLALADVPLSEIAAKPVVDPAADEVAQLIVDQHDAVAFARIRSLTVGEFREYLLADEADEPTLHALHRGITPDIAAAVTKLMSNKELAYV